jgi:hypothetical protein
MLDSTKYYIFYKDVFGWFIDLPEWTGERGDLQMVSGADTFLDILSQGRDVVCLRMSKEPFLDCQFLQFQEIGRLEGPELGEGAWYFLQSYQGINYCLRMWLCDVTKFLFVEFPNKIYFQVI